MNPDTAIRHRLRDWIEARAPVFFGAREIVVATDAHRYTLAWQSPARLPRGTWALGAEVEVTTAPSARLRARLAWGFGDAVIALARTPHAEAE